jgi:hypothetical protein
MYLLRVESGGGHLQILVQRFRFGFRERWGILSLAELLLALQETFFCMELLITFIPFTKFKYSLWIL